MGFETPKERTPEEITEIIKAQKETQKQMIDEGAR